MPKISEITCVLVSIKYQKPGSDWVKLLIRHQGEHKMAVGNVDASTLSLYHDYLLHGYWEHHETYGLQFKFSSMGKSIPVTYQGVIRYLCQGEGLGLARAKALWTRYEDKALEVVRTQPQLVADALGVSLELATRWADFFGEKIAEEKFDQDLMGLLSGFGFQYEKVKKATKILWGAAAAETIRRDPFKLLQYKIPSCGFLRCDQLYMALGKNPNRLRRQAYCALHAFQTARSGDSWHDEFEADKAILNKIGGAKPRAPKALELLRRVGALERWEDTPGHYLTADRESALWERRLAENIARLLQAKPEWTNWLAKDGLNKLYECQKPQVLAALEKHPLFLLIGPPGTGKSFVLAQIVKAISKSVRLENIGVVALAGKAAVRCTDLMVEAGVFLRGRTIHSTMDVDFNDGTYNFVHSRDKPLPYKVLIIDEISMLDTTLQSKVFDALKDGTHVIMVGDDHQLEPVGNGAPLRDMLAAGVPTVRLTEIQRFEGTIVRVCHSMVNNGPFFTDDQIRLDLVPPQNMKLLYTDPSLCQQRLTEVMSKIKEIGAHDPVWDVQVMVAVNDSSVMGRKSVNAIMQNLLNPRTPKNQVDGNPFRVGDKVMNLKNGMLSESQNEHQKHWIANGEFGEVMQVEARKSVVSFGGRHCLVNHGKLKTGEDSGGDDPAIDLAYAVTVHKMQGSQTPIAIVVLDEYGGASGSRGVCGKAWLYTAISRAQELCFLLGRHTTALKMMGKSGLHNRKTRLADYLREQLGSQHATTHTSACG